VRLTCPLQRSRHHFLLSNLTNIIRPLSAIALEVIILVSSSAYLAWLCASQIFSHQRQNVCPWSTSQISPFLNHVPFPRCCQILLSMHDTNLYCRDNPDQKRGIGLRPSVRLRTTDTSVSNREAKSGVFAVSIAHDPVLIRLS
jgi:hypothetical protein